MYIQNQIVMKCTEEMLDIFFVCFILFKAVKVLSRGVNRYIAIGGICQTVKFRHWYLLKVPSLLWC